MFQIQCQESRQFFRSTAERCLLIGSAAHCDCRHDHLPKLAAVAARIGDGWILFDLHATSLTHNDTALSGQVDLNEGDTITVGGRRFSVVHGGAGQPGKRSRIEKAECQVVLKSPDRSAQTVTLNSTSLIGSSEVCDVILPDVSDIRARHCLLVVAAEGWFAIDLTASSPNGRNGREWTELTPLHNDDRVSIADLRLEIRRVIPTAAGQDVSESETHAIASQTPRTLRRSPVISSGGSQPPTDTPQRPLPPPGKAGIDPELSVAATDVFRQLKALRMYHSEELQSGWSPIARFRNIQRLAKAEAEFVEGRQLAALNTIEELIASDPWNRQLILAFVRMCDVAGLHQLVLRTLGLLYRQNHDDVVVVKSMARVCFQLAGTDAQYFQVCIRYWRRVQELRPDERRAIESSIRSISATAVLRQSQFHRVDQ